MRFFLAILAASAAMAQAPDRVRPKASEWESVFDGKSLEGWKETPFQGHGRVRIENGELILARGGPMTGVTWQGSFPKSNYELRFEAARLEGSDFFASVTFPVKDSFCTWVLGGWGGDIVGLSSLDGWDASDNETRSYFEFEKARWYKLRLEVTDDRIRAWIDDVPVINAEIAGRKISLRPGDTRLTAPFGFMSYGTTGGVRKMQYRMVRQAP